MTDTDEIRALLNRRVDALRRRDAASANDSLSRHVVAFEVAGPLQVPSAQATDIALTQAWLDSFDEGPSVTIEELAIHAEGTVAFCHSLNRLQGRRTDGQEIDVTMRSTLGLLKQDGEWKIIHGHTSFPR
jgi:ketosteroid isomerase-like protein